MNENKPTKLSLGIALLLIGIMLITYQFYTPDVIESDSFASEPVKVEGFDSGGINDEELPNRIIIPSVSVDIEVGKAEIVNGYWEVFPNKAAWGYGSGVPGAIGNQVIFAHARDGLFLPLRDVSIGDKVYVLTQEGHFEYEVDEMKEVYPDETEVIAPSDDEILTLYTCSGYRDSKRLIVVGKRIRD